MAETKDRDPVLFEVSKFLASALLILMVKEFDSVRTALIKSDPDRTVSSGIALFVALIYCANIFRAMHSMLRLQCRDLLRKELTSFGASWLGNFSLFAGIFSCLLVSYVSLNSLNSLKDGSSGNVRLGVLIFLVLPVFAYVGLDIVVGRSVAVEDVRAIARNWVWMDATALGLCVVAACVRLFSPVDLSYRGCALVVGMILFVLFLWDYWQQRVFYFPPREAATKVVAGTTV